MPALPFFVGLWYSYYMNGQTVSFQSVIENGFIKVPEVYQKAFTSPVVVTLKEPPKEKPLTPAEITARLNEIYAQENSHLDEDFQYAAYKVFERTGWND
jgi:hypothetical protein